MNQIMRQWQSPKYFVHLLCLYSTIIILIISLLAIDIPSVEGNNELSSESQQEVINVNQLRGSRNLIFSSNEHLLEMQEQSILRKQQVTQTIPMYHKQQQKYHTEQHRRNVIQEADHDDAIQNTDDGQLTNTTDEFRRILIEPFTVYFYPVLSELSLFDSDFLLGTIEYIIFQYIITNQLNNKNQTAKLDMVRMGNIETGVVGSTKIITIKSNDTSTAGRVPNVTAFMQIEKGLISIHGLQSKLQDVNASEVNEWVQHALISANFSNAIYHQQLQERPRSISKNLQYLERVQFNFTNLTNDDTPTPTSNDTDSINGNFDPTTSTSRENGAKASLIAPLTVAGIAVIIITAFLIVRQQRKYDDDEDETSKTNMIKSIDGRRSSSFRLDMEPVTSSRRSSSGFDRHDKATKFELDLVDNLTTVADDPYYSVGPIRGKKVRTETKSTTQSLDIDNSIINTNQVHNNPLFRASPTPSDMESEWSVSTETNDTKILKSIHDLGHAIDVPISMYHNIIELESIDALRHHHHTKPDAVLDGGSPSSKSSGRNSDKEVPTNKLSLDDTAINAFRIATRESFEMERPVSLRKDMLANSWAGTFHRGPTLIKLNRSGSTNSANDKNDPNTDNDNNPRRTKSLRSKVLSPLVPPSSSNSNSGESVLQPNYFSVTKEHKIRKQLAAAQKRLQRCRGSGFSSGDDIDDRHILEEDEDQTLSENDGTITSVSDTDAHDDGVSDEDEDDDDKGDEASSVRVVVK